MSYFRTRTSEACARSASPSPTAPGLDTARSLFASFHRFGSGRVLRVPCRRLMPPVIVHLGWLRGLVYSSDRSQQGRPRSYVHFLDEPARLACDPGGRQLYVIGGRYRVTHRGIEG